MDADRLLLTGLEYVGWRTGIRHRIRTGDQYVQSLVFGPYQTGVSALVSALRAAAPSKYTDADPFKTLTVDPTNIVFETEDHFRHRGWVIDGNWDLQRRQIDSTPLYQYLKNRFVNGESWDNSGYINYVRSQIEGNSNSWGLTSHDQIKDRCKYLDRLWESIREEGYKSQAELLEARSTDTYRRNVDEIHPRLNEVGIDIGRGGELLWNRVGHHRLIMAKLLDVESVPVLVYRRHSDWQVTRDTISMGDTVSDVDESHPDLADVSRNK